MQRPHRPRARLYVRRPPRRAARYTVWHEVTSCRAARTRLLLFVRRRRAGNPTGEPVRAQEGGLYEAALTGDLGAAKRRLSFTASPTTTATPSAPRRSWWRPNTAMWKS